ncbi:MAG TPA: histidinol-phosphate transaminase [Anaerolineae bacterium]|jgi:histidinol-phosphate aminotransferase
MNAEDLIAPHLLAMEPYAPIVPFDVLSKRLGIPRSDIIKLDANENPYGPSPRALRALSTADTLHIYPDPNQTRLREAISSYIGIPTENILCGSGADELIDIIGRAFIEPGDAVIDLPPTFGMYRFEADVAHAKYISVPRRDNFAVDVDAIERAVTKTQHLKLLFVTNPNNPDGSVLSDTELKRLLNLPLIVVLDEAYIDFSTQPSRVDWVMHQPNLIVLRTFSKLAGLAGLRVGYGVFPADIIQHLWKVKQPYTPNVAGSIAAIAALEDPAYLHQGVQLLTAERVRMKEALSQFSWMKVFPSEANFLLCQIASRLSGFHDARGLKMQLEQHGILVRYFDRERLRDCIRISVGRPQDTDRVISQLVALDV